MNAAESYQHEEQEPTIAEPLTSILDVVGIKAPEPISESMQQPVAGPSGNKAKDAYADWMTAPDDKTKLHTVVTTLNPTINSVLAGMQGAGNPHMQARARIVTAKAIQTYDPAYGASLPTWVSQQLRQLVRDTRKSNSVVSTADNVQLDGYAIHRAEQELMDELDREPTVEELADKSRLSVKRIASVRGQLKPIATEGSFDSDAGTSLIGGPADFTQDAQDYVYHESDTTDKKLIEFTTGYGGSPILDTKQLMERLKLTPVQLTRRRTRLAVRINDIVSDLEGVQ